MSHTMITVTALALQYTHMSHIMITVTALALQYTHMSHIMITVTALALQYMRSMHVSHMDLKPQNILLSSQTNTVLKVAGEINAHFSQISGLEAACLFAF